MNRMSNYDISVILIYSFFFHGQRNAHSELFSIVWQLIPEPGILIPLFDKFPGEGFLFNFQFNLI